MKIVSISTADRKWLLSNYGGMLQHFALREVLKGMGFAPYRIEAVRRNQGVSATAERFMHQASGTSLSFAEEASTAAVLLLVAPYSFHLRLQETCRATL